MLFTEGGFKKEDTAAKQVDASIDQFMVAYLLPCFGHLRRVVDIVNHNNALLFDPFRYQFKVSHGGFIAMVGIHQYKIYFPDIEQSLPQGFIYVAMYQRNIFFIEKFKVGQSNIGTGFIAFEGHHLNIIFQSHIERGDAQGSAQLDHRFRFQVIDYSGVEFGNGRRGKAFG